MVLLYNAINDVLELVRNSYQTKKGCFCRIILICKPHPFDIQIVGVVYMCTRPYLKCGQKIMYTFTIVGMGAQ